MLFLFGSLTMAQNLQKRPKSLQNPLTPIGSCRDLHKIETRGTWPWHIFMNIIVLMGKPPLEGIRPIALMPTIYRLWTTNPQTY